jgi:cardiolipin synthase
VRIIGAGTRANVEYRELDTVWTVPNLITFLRFLCIPVFVWLTTAGDYGRAVIILIVLGSTDWVDGYIARRFNQISKVGTWLDPVADRLSLIIIAATFVATGIAPGWLVYGILVPDAILILTALFLFHGNPRLDVTVVGKIRTAVFLVGTPLLLLSRVPGMGGQALELAANILLAVGVLGHVIAAAGYLMGMRRKHRAGRISGKNRDHG